MKRYDAEIDSITPDSYEFGDAIVVVKESPTGEFYYAHEVDARIAKMERQHAEDTSINQSLRLLDIDQKRRIAELEKAAKAVCDYDWSDNDDDAVRAIEKLRRVL